MKETIKLAAQVPDELDGERLDKAAAARSVGTALGQNPLAYLIPCHRVIRETGVFSDYRWGRERKRAMVAWESSTRSRRTPAYEQ